MKKSRIIAIAMVVMMVVGAMVLMACSNCPGGGNLGGDSGNCYYSAYDTKPYKYCSDTSCAPRQAGLFASATYCDC